MAAWQVSLARTVVTGLSLKELTLPLAKTSFCSRVMGVSDVVDESSDGTLGSRSLAASQSSSANYILSVFAITPIQLP